MLTQAEVDRFKSQGYLQGPRLVSDAYADVLRERMFRVLNGKSSGNPELNRNLLGDGSEKVVHQIVNIWEADALFREHIYNSRLCAMVSQLIGHPVVRVWHDQVQYKPPKIGGPTDWHQDHPYWPVIEPADVVSAWTALDDATVENGCMWMVPGSHAWGAYKKGTIGTDPKTFAPTPELELAPKDARRLVR